MFDTGSFMRKELVDDYPEESEKKLREDYEREKQQQETFNATVNNPFQQGALAGTFN